MLNNKMVKLGFLFVVFLGVFSTIHLEAMWGKLFGRKSPTVTASKPAPVVQAPSVNTQNIRGSIVTASNSASVVQEPSVNTRNKRTDNRKRLIDYDRKWTSIPKTNKFVASVEGMLNGTKKGPKNYNIRKVEGEAAGMMESQIIFEKVDPAKQGPDRVIIEIWPKASKIGNSRQTVYLDNNPGKYVRPVDKYNTHRYEE